MTTTSTAATAAGQNGAGATPQPDPQETREWTEAIEGVLEHEGPARAQELINAIVETAQRGGAHVSLGLSTPYINTIPPSEQAPLAGNDELETRIRHYVRWNAAVMLMLAV
jgi:pyruvate dehydrogenase E1 component